MAKNLLAKRYGKGYTYGQLVELWIKRGKKDHVNMNYCSKLYKSDTDDTFIFQVNGTTHAYIYPSNNIKLVNVSLVAKHTTNTQEAKALEGLTGMAIARHSKYASYEQPVRIYLRWGDLNAAALFEGVTVNQCRVINANAFVDCKPRLNREKSLVIQRKLRPLAKLLRVSAKLDLMNGMERTKNITDIDLDNPTIDDAVAIYTLVGGAGWNRRYWYNNTTPERQAAERMREANLALRKYTELLYQQADAYEMIPVEQLAKMKEAA